MRPFLVIFTAVLLLSPLASGTETASSARSQSVGIDLSVGLEPYTFANASDGNQIVRIPGRVSVDKPPIGKVLVYLESYTTGGWLTECIPTQIEFLTSGSENFSCSLNIPGRTTNVTATVTVIATLEGSVEPIRASANGTLEMRGSVLTNDSPAQTPPPAGVRGGQSLLDLAGSMGGVLILAATVALIILAAAIVIRTKGRARS